MQVVHPYLTENWQELSKVATQWTQAEPNTLESWFYLATTEYAAKEYDKAALHMQRVVALNHQHSQAIYYLGLIAEATGQHSVALNNVALLDQLDENTALQLKGAIGINELPR
jgi:tetratricopeptide (TPR) repeat protein